MARVEELLGAGNHWCVDCDLKSYFDTIPHDRLMARIKERIVDGPVLAVLEQCLKAGVMEELTGWQPTERGTPQGAVISPMLANLYLNPLDHEMARRGWTMVRYAEDLVVLCRTQAEAEAVLNELRHWTDEAGLRFQVQYATEIPASGVIPWITVSGYITSTNSEYSFTDACTAPIKYYRVLRLP